MRLGRVLAILMLFAASAQGAPTAGSGGTPGPPGSGGTPSDASVTPPKMGSGNFGASDNIGFTCVAGVGCYLNSLSVFNSQIAADAIKNINVAPDAAIAGSKLANTPAGDLTSTNVQAAINELDNDKLAVSNSVHIDEIQNQLLTPVTVDWNAFVTDPATYEFDTLEHAINSLARYMRGGFDVVVDVNGDTDACHTIQRLGIQPWLTMADDAAGIVRVKVHGVATVPLADTKDYTTHRVCIMAGGSPGSLDANGYPSTLTGSINREDKRLFLDLSGLELTVSTSGATKPTVVLQIGGHATNWTSEFTATVNNSVYLRGSPRLACGNFTEDAAYQVTWPQSRANAMTGTGALFSGGQWAPGSCVGLLENHARRNDWSDFHPYLYSWGTNHNVGWLAVAAWQTNRGMFEASGMHTSFQVYGNMAAGSVGLRGGGTYGFICGDHLGHGCSGLRVREGQLEGATQSEIVINSGTAVGSFLSGAGDLTFANMHIESEGSATQGRSPHIIIGPGYSTDSRDTYRPCTLSSDNPTLAECACPTAASANYFGTINFKNTSLPGTRYDKAFRLSAYGVGTSRAQFKACAVAGHAVEVHTAAGDAPATVRNGLDDLYWSGVTDASLYDVIRVTYNSSYPQLQPEFNVSELNCVDTTPDPDVTYTATIGGGAGGDSPFALGPCTYMSTANYAALSVINFNGSQVALDLVGDRAERELVTTETTTGYPALFTADPNSNIRMNYQGAGGYTTNNVGPVSFPADQVLTDFHPFVPRGTVAPPTQCNRADQAGRLFWDTDQDTTGSLMVCRGADGWKSMR